MPKRSDPARRALVEQRRSQILSAALTVFARKGYERATIADIAREAGVAEGSIYNYFKNKPDLLVSLPRQIIQPNVDSLAHLIPSAAGEPIAPPQVVLPRVAHAVVATLRENAAVFRILLSALPSLKPAVRQRYVEQVVFYVLGVLESYMRACIAQGILRADLEPGLAARAFIGLFFPYILFESVLQLPASAPLVEDEMVEQLVSIFIDGALAHPEPVLTVGEGTVE